MHMELEPAEWRIYSAYNSRTSNVRSPRAVRTGVADRNTGPPFLHMMRMNVID